MGRLLEFLPILRRFGQGDVVEGVSGVQWKNAGRKMGSNTEVGESESDSLFCAKHVRKFWIDWRHQAAQKSLLVTEKAATVFALRKRRLPNRSGPNGAQHARTATENLAQRSRSQEKQNHR